MAIKRIKTIGTGLLLLTLIFVLIGCVANYGRLDRNSEVTRMFMSQQILPDYQYYYSGPDNSVRAILGLKTDYELKTSLWKPVDLTPEKLRLWLRLMDYGSLGDSPHGYYIEDPQGNPIGVWFSIWRSTSVKFVSENQVVVQPPSYYPGTNVRPSMERGSVEIPPNEEPLAMGDQEFELSRK
jgi:hypothetical protein